MLMKNRLLIIILTWTFSICQAERRKLPTEVFELYLFWKRWLGRMNAKMDKVNWRLSCTFFWVSVANHRSVNINQNYSVGSWRYYSKHYFWLANRTSLGICNCYREYTLRYFVCRLRPQKISYSVDQTNFLHLPTLITWTLLIASLQDLSDCLNHNF